jgi:ribosome biogenesis GTPase / thiamine phosphate phosphatase
VQLIGLNREPQLSEVAPRRNFLARTYGGKMKEIAVNLDLVAIVSAVGPLFSTDFVDRVLAVAWLQAIPSVLIVNKIDLGVDSVKGLIDVYQQLGERVILTSIRKQQGVEEVARLFSAAEIRTVALVGISGVGKSALFNYLIPAGGQKTAAVSRKTGQGRRTTSVAVGHRYLDRRGQWKLLIDLPGIQNFGVSDLSAAKVALAFPEFTARQGACEYSDCRHRAEPNCAVKDAVDRGEIALSRYRSYLNMLTEIDAAQQF